MLAGAEEFGTGAYPPTDPSVRSPSRTATTTDPGARHDPQARSLRAGQGALGGVGRRGRRQNFGQQRIGRGVEPLAARSRTVRRGKGFDQSFAAQFARAASPVLGRAVVNRVEFSPQGRRPFGRSGNRDAQGRQRGHDEQDHVEEE